MAGDLVLSTSNSLQALALALTGVDFEDTPRESIADLLRASTLDSSDLEAYIQFDRARYTRHLIFRTDAFELVVLHWPQGSGSAIHDHGNQNCYMAVGRGSLGVENFVVLSGGKRQGYAHIAPSGTEIMPAGTVDVRTSTRDLHRVTATAGPAVSVHVYAKPIDRFLIFDQTRRSCRTAFGRYDSVPASSGAAVTQFGSRRETYVRSVQ